MSDATPPATRVASRKRRHTRTIIIAASAVVVIGLIVAAYFLFFFRPTAVATGARDAALGDPAIATVLPAKGWSVTGDATDTLELVSPDRMLTVTFARGPGGDPANAVGSAPRSGPNTESGGKVRTEKLASGLTIAHRDAAAHITAAVGDGTHSVLAEVQLDQDSAKQAKRDLATYRPALSDLFESLRLKG